MTNDPIVEEVRSAREAYAAQFQFDLRRMAEDLSRRERESGRTYLRLSPKVFARTPTPAKP